MRVTLSIEPTCNLCRLCIELCPTEVFRIEGNRLIHEDEKCIYCRGCELLCPQKAITAKPDLKTLKYANVVMELESADRRKHF